MIPLPWFMRYGKHNIFLGQEEGKMIMRLQERAVLTMDTAHSVEELIVLLIFSYAESLEI